MIEVSRVLLGLRRARWLLGSAAILGIGAGIALGKTVAPVEYDSHATLLWEPDAAEQADRARAEKTLIESIEIPSMLNAIRERLHSPMSIEQLSASIEVTNTNQSNVLVLVAKGDDPTVARRLGEAAVDALMEARKLLHATRAADDLARLDGDLERARTASENARGELNAFRHEHHLVDVASETEHAIEEAARLRSEANTAAADAETADSRAETLRRFADSERPRTKLSERIVHPGAVKLAEVRVEKKRLGAELSAEHPDVLALDAAESALVGSENDGATAEETFGRNPRYDALEDDLAKAASDAIALRSRHDAYAQLADEAERRVGELGDIEARAASLVVTSQAAEKRLGDLDATRASLKDTSESPPSGLRILAESDLPTHPSRSLRKIIAIATPLVALLAVLVAVLVRALWGLRVHTANELAYHAQLPVVATSRWPLDPTELDDLAVDLAEMWPAISAPTKSRDRGASPALAIVAFGKGDATSAEDLAKRITDRVSSRDSSVSLVEIGSVPPHPSIAASTRALEQSHPETRRLIRRAERLLIVVHAGAHSAISIRRMRDLIGRNERIGLVLIGAQTELLALPDRVGDPAEFLAAC